MAFGGKQDCGFNQRVYVQCILLGSAKACASFQGRGPPTSVSTYEGGDSPWPVLARVGRGARRAHCAPGAAEVVRSRHNGSVISKADGYGRKGLLKGWASVIIPTRVLLVFELQIRSKFMTVVLVPDECVGGVAGLLGGMASHPVCPRERAWHDAWCKGGGWFVYFLPLQAPRARLSS